MVKLMIEFGNIVLVKEREVIPFRTDNFDLVLYDFFIAITCVNGTRSKRRHSLARTGVIYWFISNCMIEHLILEFVPLRNAVR
jgi:hypothetical protein